MEPSVPTPLQDFFEKWMKSTYNQSSAQKPEGTSYLLCISVMVKNEDLSQSQQYKDRQ
ncbi:transposase IS66 domain protein [Phocaeicola vulgatus str. 3775 SL(B) 10 (iv)]|uniref:Transposase IS66 domain protein n=1 Tax=Phocaeicola vulgatus str. 3775 SL(B) 10 (iv) TaxID=1339350 RepID=A0A078QNJ7_PHOVU|nr:transposase IS66 domain protein [Phocaeicola vulgatus str. 3775 SL(B) 10 (iv)]KDS30954.1 transposase IS66 domain protein [Phocaeicola vulgatus str. 3775 SR(B) 19]